MRRLQRAQELLDVPARTGRAASVRATTAAPSTRWARPDSARRARRCPVWPLAPSMGGFVSNRVLSHHTLTRHSAHLRTCYPLEAPPARKRHAINGRVAPPRWSSSTVWLHSSEQLSTIVCSHSSKPPESSLCFSGAGVDLDSVDTMTSQLLLCDVPLHLIKTW